MNRMDHFHPKLRPYIRALLSHEFGLPGHSAEVNVVESGSIFAKNMSELGDRFQLKIPYCRKALYWQVLMNPNNLTEPPDFIMEERFFDVSSDVIKNHVPSLDNWCPSNVKCLLQIILELLDLYKSQQVNILKITPNLQRCSFEYDTLISTTTVSASDVEVCIQNTNRGIIITFLIRINLDFSKLPAVTPHNKNTSLLMVEFKESTRNVLQLIPREELECALGGPVDLPELPPDISLMDYVPMVEELLQEKIKVMQDGVKQRRLLYTHLVQYFEPSLLNADTITFQDVSFLLESKGFFCVLQIHIPIEFPKSRPKITLLSLYNNRQGVPLSEDYCKCNFNPKMHCDEMAKEIYQYVVQKAMVNFRDTLTLR